jgi:endogenous inhibitor of DNA gyrase (YacG/DUF329 family)
LQAIELLVMRREMQAKCPLSEVRITVSATPFCELRKAMGTSKLINLVSLIDLHPWLEPAVCIAGTSDRRY